MNFNDNPWAVPIGPIITTTQADTSDSIGLETVEIKGAEFPMTQNQIAAMIREKDNHSLKTTQDSRKVGWLVFTLHDNAEVIQIEHLCAYDNEWLNDVIDSMMKMLTTSPKADDAVTIRTIWPEYGTDNHIFKALLGYGFAVTGLDRFAFRAYNADYDGIKLEKTFGRK